MSIFQWAETWASSLALKRSGCLINMSCLRISFEGRMLKLKLQYFGHLTQRAYSLENTDAGRDWGQEEKGMTEDEMAGWHH